MLLVVLETVAVARFRMPTIAPEVTPMQLTRSASLHERLQSIQGQQFQHARSYVAGLQIQPQKFDGINFWPDRYVIGENLLPPSTPRILHTKYFRPRYGPE